MKSDDLIMIVVIGAIAYFVLIKSGIFGAKPIDQSNPCPYGQEYDRPLFEACETGYLSSFWSNTCECTGGQ